MFPMDFSLGFGVWYSLWSMSICSRPIRVSSTSAVKIAIERITAHRSNWLKFISIYLQHSGLLVVSWTSCGEFSATLPDPWEEACSSWSAFDCSSSTFARLFEALPLGVFFVWDPCERLLITAGKVKWINAFSYWELKILTLFPWSVLVKVLGLNYGQ